MAAGGDAVILRPFFRYYGSKWRAVHAGLYPQPTHHQICEPFAGAAGYSLHYPEHSVDLYERDPVIARIWQWLIHAWPEEVRAIPLVDAVDDLPSWVSTGARYLVGFSMNAATSSPRKTLSAGARRLREQGRKFYGWTHELRERVAAQVPHIKHWRIHIDDMPNASICGTRTWFVDPPYVGAGKHYKFGPEQVRYAALAEWCKTRHGQVIVCEAEGANWLPFRSIGAIKSGPRTRTTREACWP